MPCRQAEVLFWGHRSGIQAWQLQIMLTEVEGDEWFSRRSRLIRGQRNELIVLYHGIRCLRIEVQLLYKARNQRPKDDLDFQACLPLLLARNIALVVLPSRGCCPKLHK